MLRNLGDLRRAFTDKISSRGSDKFPAMCSIVVRYQVDIVPTNLVLCKRDDVTQHYPIPKIGEYIYKKILDQH